MYIKTFTTTLLEMFCKLLLHSQVIIKNMLTTLFKLNCMHEWVNGLIYTAPSCTLSKAVMYRPCDYQLSQKEVKERDIVEIFTSCTDTQSTSYKLGRLTCTVDPTVSLFCLP